MTMRVCAYHSAEAPANYRWIAYIFVPAVRREKGEDGKTIKVPAGETALPVYFKGATKEAAVTRAHDFWHSEKAKEAARDASIARRREAARLMRLEKASA